VPRFRCRVCGAGFSRQTFRADRRQKKPHINATCLDLMVACVGLRQAARVLRVARRTVERRFHWMGRHAADFQANRLAQSRLFGPFQMDELETFEANRYQPVTVAVVIERSSLFIVDTAVGPLRRKGRMTSLQRRRRRAHEALHGRRPSDSYRAVQSVLGTLRKFAPDSVVLESDEKLLYGALGRRILGPRFTWRTHSASARRDHRNPLFPINHTNARLRHFLSRLRRRTWCVSKKRDGLKAHLSIAVMWSNFCRGITNRTRTTPAQSVLAAPRTYRPEEVLAWRQDWGTLSPGLQ
jgi:hypothetical protein